MERVTCFKLCYALGVPSQTLRTDFNVEYRVAKMANAQLGTAIQKYHKLAAVYFKVMSHYYEYADTRKFGRVISASELVPPRNNRPLLVYLQEIVALHNAIWEKAYEELNIAIPKELFAELTVLPELNVKTAAQIAFLMAKTRHMYGLYFFNNELLNVALGDMLKDDLSLTDRLSLLVGSKLEFLHDASGLPEAVQSYLDGVFVPVENLHSLGKLCYFDSETAISTNVFSVVNQLKERDEVGSVVSRTQLQAGDCVVTGNSQWVFGIAREMSEVNFAIVLPVESKYYRVWRRRAVPNVYLVSQN